MLGREERHIFAVTGPRFTNNDFSMEKLRSSLTFYDGTTLYECGDGKAPITEAKLEQDAMAFAFKPGRKIVLINCHGNKRDNGSHFIELGQNSHIDTKILFAMLRRHITCPLVIFLASCYGGAVFQDMDILPVGSIIFTSAPSTHPAYLADGIAVAQALKQLLLSGMHLDFGMYFFASTYLSSHGNFQGNPPRLHVRVADDVHVKGRIELIGEYVNQPYSVPNSSILLRQLEMSPYAALRNNMVASLDTGSESSNVSVQVIHALQPWPKLWKHISNGGRFDSLRLSSFETSQFRTALHNTALVLFLTKVEYDAVRIARNHKIFNTHLLVLALDYKFYFLVDLLIDNATTLTDIKVKGIPLIFELLEHPHLLRKAIPKGLDVNVQKPGDLVTPLHISTKLECTSILLEAGADPNLFDANRYTPLHWSTFNGNLQKFVTLYSHPATDRTMLTQDNKDYFEFARQHGKEYICQKILELLRLHKPPSPKRKEPDTLPAPPGRTELKVRFRNSRGGWPGLTTFR